MTTLIVDHTHEAAGFLPLTDDQKVDARALHGWLGIGKDFSTWVRKIIADYGFEEGADYSPILGNRSDGRAGKPRKDYLLSLDVAKEIAMIGNTPKGKATRRYFIAAEKAAAKMASGQVAEGRADFFNAREEFGAMERRIMTALTDQLTNILHSLPGATWKDASGKVHLIDDMSEDHLRRIVKGDYAEGAALERIKQRLQSFNIDKKLARKEAEEADNVRRREKAEALLNQMQELAAAAKATLA